MSEPSYKPCGRCNGRGQIMTPLPNNSRDSKPGRCPACGGSGKRLVWR